MDKLKTKAHEFMSEVVMQMARPPETGFANAYDAGVDAKRSGPNTNNCNFRWFSSKASMQEWQRGYDAKVSP